MAKINIAFDGKIYTVDENTLIPLASPLIQTLVGQLAGTGVVIKLGGSSYDVDVNKLASARNVLTDHLGDVAGTDSKVTVAGTEYGLSKAKLQNATDKMHSTLTGMRTYSKGLWYELNDDGMSYSVCGMGTCTDTDLIIPDVHNGLPVTSFNPDQETFYDEQIESVYIPGSIKRINGSSFVYCEKLKSVFIAEGVESIGRWAFDGCSNLQDVSIPSTIVDIESTAFSGCPKLNGYLYNGGKYLGNEKVHNIVLIQLVDTTITTFIFPDETVCIMPGVFKNCTNLENVIMNNKITNIPSEAFRGCSNLKNFTLGTGLTYIDSYAFDGCTNLTNVYCNGGMATWCNIGFPGVKDYEFGYLESFSSPMQYATNLYLENSIGEYELFDGNLIIPDENKEIYTGAFYGDYWNCVTDITIHDGVEFIGENAFDSTSYYKNNENWEDGVLYIGNYLVDVRGVPETYTMKPGVKLIAGMAFFGSGIKELYISDSVEFINYRAFFWSGITTIHMPSELKEIDYQAFDNCDGLTDVYITDIATWCEAEIHFNPMTYAQNVYLNGELITDLVIPNGTTVIKSQTLDSIKTMTSITIPDSVISIDGFPPFEYCYNLAEIIVDENNTVYKSIDGNLYSKDEKTLIRYAPGKVNTSFTIPNTVIDIDRFAFRDCNNLVSLTIGNSVTSMPEGVISGCDNLTSVILSEGFTRIYDGMFEYCNNLTSITIPDSVTSIGSAAFEGCTNLTSITIPDSVTSIGGSAFWGCENLTSIIIPDSVTSIGEYLFQDCNSLTSVTIGNSVTSISEYAFHGCSSLTSVIVDENNLSYKSIDGNLYSKDGKTLIQYTIGKSDTSFVLPSSVTNIGSYAFSDCSKLTSVTIPDSVTNIGPYAFHSCSELTSITIPDSVTNIGSSAFDWCGKLTSVTIGDSVTNIGSSAFAYCNSLTSVTIPDSVTSIGNRVFSSCQKLTSVTIGNGVTSIGSEVFHWCFKLTDIYIDRSEGSVKLGADWCPDTTTIHWNSTGPEN